MAVAVILGSGTSNGVPMLGHEYPPAYLANPKNHRTRSSLLLLGPTGNLLVDCSPEMRLQVTRERVYDIEATLITHTHADHVMGMDDLRSMCLKTGRAMPVYTLPEHQAEIKRIFPYAFQIFPPGIHVPRFDLLDVPYAPSEFEVGGMLIKTFVVQHGRTRVIGVRVNDFAYVTDVSEIPPDAWAMLGGLKILILDAVRRKPHPNHFHLDRAIEVATAIGADKTYFTHLSHDYDHDITNAELPDSILLSYDGQRISI